MKIQLNYEPGTGQITDNNGTYISTWHGLDADHKVKDQPTDLPLDMEYSSITQVSDLIKLKEAGFTAYEIIAMQARGVI